LYDRLGLPDDDGALVLRRGGGDERERGYRSGRDENVLHDSSLGIRRTSVPRRPQNGNWTLVQRDKAVSFVKNPVMRVPTASLVALLAIAPGLAEAQRPPTALEYRSQPWLGDFDGMVERRLVRVLVPYSRTLYFNDKGAQRGLTAAAVRDFERFLGDKLKLRGRLVTVVAMPTTRDRLIQGLVEGRGD